MVTLFPALQGKKRKFDSADDCVVAANHRKKKAGNPSSSGRAKMLKVVCLKNVPPVIPKGRIRDELVKKGMIREVPFRRSMTECDVTTSITACLKASTSDCVTYLQAHRDNSLKVNAVQSLDGAGVIGLAGCGSLYVVIKKKVSPQVSPATSRSPTPEASDDGNLSSTSKQIIERNRELLAELKVHSLIYMLINHTLSTCCRDPFLAHPPPVILRVLRRQKM